MKQYFAPLALTLLLVALPAAADDGDRMRPHDVLEAMHTRMEERKDHMEERKERMEERHDELKDRLASSSEALRERFSEHVKELVSKRAEHLGNLLDAMIARLNKLAERIQARIDLLAEDGKDVTDAQAALDRAVTQIDEADAAVADIKEALADALASETPRELLMEVKPLAETAKKALRKAHAALVETITTLPNATEDDSEDSNS